MVVLFAVQSCAVGDTYSSTTSLILVVNPRRACAARVTVVYIPVCLCICLSVCYHANEGIARLYSKMKIPTALK